MSGNCNSSPKGTCSESKTLEQLEILSELIETNLDNIIAQKEQIIIDLNACSESTNTILEDIIGKYEQIINDDCCDTTNNLLQDIIDELNNIVYSAECQLDGVIECNIEEPTTTETPTTTIAPTTTEATTTLPENAGIFYVSNIAMLPCIEDDLPPENKKTLYYEGTFGTGVTMYTDSVGGTLLSGYLYIKLQGSLSVYNLGSESGIVGTIAYTCE